MRPMTPRFMPFRNARLLASLSALAVTGLILVLATLLAGGVATAPPVQAANDGPSAPAAGVTLARVDLPRVAAQAGSPIAPRIFGAFHFGPTGPSTLVKIDPLTGNSTAIGAIGFERCTGLDFAPDGTLYGVCRRPGSSLNVLVTVDTATGAGTEVGSTGLTSDGFNSVTDISFRPSNGTLWAYHEMNAGGSTVGTINLTTGAYTAVGPTGVSGQTGNGLAFQGGTLRHTPGSNLHTINKLTGASIFVVALTYPAGYNRIPAMDLWSQNSTLYGVLAGPGPSRGLGIIAPASGNVTLVGPTVDGLAAIAVAPVGDLQVDKTCFALIGGESPLPVAAAGELPEGVTRDPEGFLQFARGAVPNSTPAQKGIAGVEWVCTVDVFNPGSIPSGDPDEPDAPAGDALNVVITDTIPAGVLYSTDTSFVPGAGDVCDIQAGAGPNGEDLLVCQIGDLQPSETLAFDIEFVIDPDYVAGESDGQRPLTNQVCVSSDSGDIDDFNNCGDDTDFINDRADLTVLKMSKPDHEVRAGQPFSYTIIVENLGPSYARGVYIRDDILFSEGLELLQLHNDPNRNDACAVVTDDVGRKEILCELFEPLEPVGDWVSDGTGRWIIRMTVGANDTQDINNLVRVYTGPQPDGIVGGLPVNWATGTVDQDESNNRAEDFISIIDTTDLEISKRSTPGSSSSPELVTAGELLKYTILVTNTGSGWLGLNGSTATNVHIYDNLPAEVELVGVSSSDGECTAGTPGDPLDPTVCVIDEMDVGETQTVTIFVRVDPDVPINPLLPCNQPAPYCRGRIFNDAWVTSDILDPELDNNRETWSTDVKYVADLELFKNDVPDPVMAGNYLTYEIIVNNRGPSVARDVVLIDQLPAAATEFVSAMALGQPGSIGACTITAINQLVCRLGDIPPGAPPLGQRTIYVTVRVKAGTAAGTITNVANTISFQTYDPNPANNLSFAGCTRCSAATTVITRADLAITKTSTPVKVYAGEQVKYTIKVENKGPSDAQSVVVTDTLPAGTTYEVDTDSCVQGPPGTLTCALGTIPAGGSVSFDIYALVAPSVAAGTTLVNRATVTAATTDPVTTNNTATANTYILGNSDLKITKFGKPDGQVRAGEVLTYTVIVDNLGPSWADEVALKDVLQSSGRFDLIDILSDRPASCAALPAFDGGNPVLLPATVWPVAGPPVPAPWGVNLPTGLANINQRLEVDCTLWDDPATPGEDESLLEILAADGPPNSGRWILTMRVRARQTQDINNVATVVAATPDPQPGNNEAKVEHEITDVADLSVTKTAMGQAVVEGCPWGTQLVADQVTAGLLLTYQMIVANAGPSAAENVVLIDRLPPGVVVIAADAPDGGACETGTAGNPLDRLTCGLGTIAVGGSKTVNVTARVSTALLGGTVLENDVFVTSDIFDPFNSDNYATNLTTVSAWADLAVTKTDQPDPVVAGELIEYTVTVRNDGPSDARGAFVIDTLDTDVHYMGFRDPYAIGVSCSLNPIDLRTLTCAVGDIEAAGVRRFTIVGQVDPNAATPLNNYVMVTSKTPDPCAQPDPNNNNEDGEGTDVEREDQLYIVKTDVPDPVKAGTELYYTVRFGNNGPSTAQNVDVFDTLPLGLTFNRCESLDPNDSVTCSVVSGNGNATQQVVRLNELLIANNVAFRSASPPDDELDPGEGYAFRLIADVESGYLLNGRGDTGVGGICRPFFQADGYPYYAHNRIDITSNVDSSFDDECTRVNGEADIEVLKFDDLAGFQECDPVAPGGVITYDILVANNGPSDGAQVYLVDWLPPDGVALDPNLVEVTIAGDRGVVLEIRDDGRITILAGNDPNNLGVNQLGRINAGLGPVQIQIRVQVLLTAECGSSVENQVSAVTQRNDTLWPPRPGALFGPTPTYDPDMTNNQDVEATRIECPAITVNKTISFNGQCPGAEHTVLAEPGQPVTFCFEITNSGTTYLDAIALVDTLRTRTGTRVVYTDTITFGADPNAPLAPGETVHRQVTLAQLCGSENCECGTADNTVEVTALPVNLGRTPYACLPLVSGTDSQRIDVPCAGVDTRLALPALATLGLPAAPAPSPFGSGGAEVQQAVPVTECESWIQVQNVGDAPTKAMVIVWGEPGFCPPQDAGPLKIECTGLLRPGSAWSFAPGMLPRGARSGIVYSLNAVDLVPTLQGNMMPFADVACRNLFNYVVGDGDQWVQFDRAYRNREVYLSPFDASGLHQLVLDFGAHQGEPLAVTVNRTCPDPANPNATGSAMYSAVSTDAQGAPDPYAGGFMYYAPMVFASKGGLNSWLYVQNVGIECTSLELWFKAQDNCMRPILGDVLSVAPGESIGFDPNTVVGPDWLGSAWIRSSQPLALVVDTMGANHFTSYNGVPGDVYSPDPGATFSLGTQVNYAPLVYNQHQGWDTALLVQNLSSTLAAKVKVYFLDKSGGIEHTMVDWICPRGSQTFFLPVIDGIPGNWVGSARVESQEWWTPGDPRVDPPRLQSVVLLEKWSDPARSERREAMAYNTATECDAYDWQIGSHRGGTQSGSAVLAVPLLAKGNRGITSELAITNLVPKPGKTDFVLFIYDQNGLLDQQCEVLNEKQVEYIDLNAWGWIHPNFLGSAVVSAVFWEHDVFDQYGGFTRNLVGLGGVIVERIGGTQGQPDVPGDESKATGMFPVYDYFLNEHWVQCPGVPPGWRP